MPSCVFRKCNNYTATIRDTGSVSFHTLPRELIMKQKWVDVIRHQRLEFDWMPTHYTTVCSSHFLPEDMYVTEKGVRRLRKNAIPIIEFKEEHTLVSPSSLVEVSMVEPVTIENEADKELKIKLRRMLFDKRKLLYKNYDLQRRNERLARKCNDLVKIVYKMKRKLAEYECIDDK